RGSVSASISVTNPCLYSRFASCSIVLVAVLISVCILHYSGQRQRDAARRAQQLLHRGFRGEQLSQADTVQHPGHHVAQATPPRAHGAIGRVDTTTAGVVRPLVAIAIAGIDKQRLT